MKNREIMMTRLLKVFNKMFNHRQPFTPEARGQLSSQLRCTRRALWRKGFRHAQGRNQRRQGCVRHHPRFDGREIVHRERSRAGGEFQLLLHGAGRKMSRGAAKRAFTKDDLARQTQGVECRKDVGVLDEIPGAYKDIKAVMRNQSDLVKIVAEIKQVVCVKG